MTAFAYGSWPSIGRNSASNLASRGSRNGGGTSVSPRCPLGLAQHAVDVAHRRKHSTTASIGQPVALFANAHLVKAKEHAPQIATQKDEPAHQTLAADRLERIEVKQIDSHRLQMPRRHQPRADPRPVRQI